MKKVNRIGYLTRHDFLEGKMQGMPLIVSWRGNTSQDWRNIHDLVYENKILYYVYENLHNVSGESNYMTTTNLTKMNLGEIICTRLENISNFVSIYGKSLQVYVSDPHLQLSFRTNMIGFSGNLMRTIGYRHNSYKIQTTIVKKRHKKNSCTAYNTDNGYMQCVETAARQQLMELLGCIPPWITKLGREEICYHDIQFNNIETANKIKLELHLILLQLGTGFDFGCKLPCNQLHLSVQQTKTDTIEEKLGAINLQFEDSVKVLEERNNYSFFDLMVEIGSSLGLWIGLSAIGIYDLFSDLMETLYKEIYLKLNKNKIEETTSAQK